MPALTSKLLSRLPSIAHAFEDPRATIAGLYRCTQVHSANVEMLETQTAPVLQACKADGIVTGGPGRVGVQTADCLPVLFAARSGSHVAAVHAGWRGLNQGILVRTVERFTALGVSPKELVAAIGPAIGPCCFEVNREVVDAFEKEWGRLWRDLSARPWQQGQRKSANPARSPAPISENDLWLDLEKVARLQLVDAGLNDAQIEDVGHCTYCGPGELASYRRATHERGSAGRQWSWIQRTN